ncbi:MAG: SPOR domain-containing protein [Bacteroidales bacterium]
MRNIVTLFLLVVTALLPIFGQSFQANRDSTILQSLMKQKPGQGVVIVHQSDAIAKLLGVRSYSETKNEFTQEGYRVQVFSGNNQTKSKSEANWKQDKVKEMFPNLQTYVTFKSPFWRLRVGDFRSYEEADQLMRQLKRAFPQFGKEMYVVRDEIKIEF